MDREGRVAYCSAELLAVLRAQHAATRELEREKGIGCSIARVVASSGSLRPGRRPARRLRWIDGYPSGDRHSALTANGERLPGEKQAGESPICQEPAT
jgi:hypothetical protein